ncbi:MAG: KH domain-containing protein [Polyangiaceae bacterium]
MSDSEQELDQDSSEVSDTEEEETDHEDDDGGDEVRADGDGDGAPRQRRRRGGRGNGEPDYLPEGDERAMQSLQFVSDVVREMEMDCKVRLRRPKGEEENPEILIEISGPDAGRIIGKKGQVLMALQFLTHRVVNRSGLEKRHVLVDAEGYRSRRDDSLASMARRLGKQAVEQGKIITFEPMNPRDRRVVHLALAKFEGVVTKSDGEGASRRVQIIPVRRSSAQTS